MMTQNLHMMTKYFFVFSMPLLYDMTFIVTLTLHDNTIPLLDRCTW